MCWVLGQILTYLKCELHKCLWSGILMYFINVCFSHVCSWKIYILITLGDMIYKDDEKI